MLTQPVGKLALADAPGGEIKHEVFLIIHPGVDLRAIENEKRLHGRMPHSLVAVDERMAQYERETERCRLLDQRGIQSAPPKVALGWATADSSAPRSRMPGALPVACRSRPCKSTTSASVTYRITRGAGITPRSS